MKLVKFDDGTYGIVIKRFLSEDVFVDLKKESLSWKYYSRFFKDCKGSEEEAREVFNKLKKPIYTIIKD